MKHNGLSVNVLLLSVSHICGDCSEVLHRHDIKQNFVCIFCTKNCSAWPHPPFEQFEPEPIWWPFVLLYSANVENRSYGASTFSVSLIQVNPKHLKKSPLFFIPLILPSNQLVLYLLLNE